MLSTCTCAHAYLRFCLCLCLFPVSASAPLVQRCPQTVSEKRGLPVRRPLNAAQNTDRATEFRLRTVVAAERGR